MARGPDRFHDFIGQKRNVRFITMLIHGARCQGRATPSILCSGPNGFGKSTFGRAISREYTSEFVKITAGSKTDRIDICKVLHGLDHGDVFVIDEAHNLDSKVGDVLLEALDDGFAPRFDERSRMIDAKASIAEFTLVLATTEPGRITSSLLSRLYECELEPYTVPELKAIGERICAKAGVTITPQAARRLAETAQGCPRTIEQRVDRLLLLFPGRTRFEIDHVRELLAREGIDERGLLPRQRQYLRLLGASRNDALPLEHLVVGLGCDSAYIRRHVEPFLFRLGLVKYGPAKVRCLTREGRSVLAEIGEADDTGEEREIR